MDISEVIRIVQDALKCDLVESKHFLDQCEDRKLESNKVKEVIKNNEILGIVEQDQNLYKVWFFYEKHKDLNVIVRILPYQKIRLVTIFPCYSERRKR